MPAGLPGRRGHRRRAPARVRAKGALRGAGRLWLRALFPGRGHAGPFPPRGPARRRAPLLSQGLASQPCPRAQPTGPSFLGAEQPSGGKKAPTAGFKGLSSGSPGAPFPRPDQVLGGQEGRPDCRPRDQRRTILQAPSWAGDGGWGGCEPRAGPGRRGLCPERAVLAPRCGPRGDEAGSAGLSLGLSPRFGIWCLHVHPCVHVSLPCGDRGFSGPKLASLCYCPLPHQRGMAVGGELGVPGRGCGGSGSESRCVCARGRAQILRAPGLVFVSTCRFPEGVNGASLDPTSPPPPFPGFSQTPDFVPRVWPELCPALNPVWLVGCGWTPALKCIPLCDPGCECGSWSPRVACLPASAWLWSVSCTHARVYAQA